jgi:hypothetical protein
MSKTKPVRSTGDPGTSPDAPCAMPTFAAQVSDGNIHTLLGLFCRLQNTRDSAGPRPD